MGMSRRTKYISIAGSVFLILVIAAVVIALRYWPFTEGAVRSELGSATSSEVRFGSFHTKYFPPGCVVENIVFQHAPSGAPPLMVIRRLTIRSTVVGLMRHHVTLLRAEGLKATLALHGFKKENSGNKTVVDRLVADDAVLDLPRRGSQSQEQFVFHKFSITNLNGGGVIEFSAMFENPLPHGVIRTSGQFGPWNANDPKASAVSGDYSLENADLSVFRSIAGDVSSTGTFHGSLKHIEVQGSTHSPELVVTRTRHGLPLDTNFSAIVDGTNGDVLLGAVKARFGKDNIIASGSIARRSDHKRSAILDLTCDRGRIEDTFYPFIKSPRSPLTGDVAFQMHVTLPSGHEPFLQKLRLASTFKIQNAQFTNVQTETRLSKVSAPPKEEESHQLADFQGRVNLAGGVAKFSDLSVHDEDAEAFFRGDYNLRNEQVNMHGKLKTAASLSKTTHGMKAVFAKAIEPFFKKKPHDTVVPVHIGGTFSHPNFGLDIGS